ncbi:MAG: hypothetical protein GC165_13475 [Armatimonadetes bacterium]|nr:hypothetical protein [Armatimonadota bacterium]
MRKSLLPIFSVVAAALFALMPIFSVAQDTDADKKAEAQFQKDIVPIVKANCISCHNKDYAKHKVAFPDKMSLEDAKKNAKLWTRAAREVKAGHMPPKGNGSMKDSERKAFLEWADKTFPKPKKDGDGGGSGN